MPEAITILALDQSTDVTGVCVVRCLPGVALPELLRHRAIDASGIDKGRHTPQARVARIGYTAGVLEGFLDSCPWRIDIVSYETDTGRGYQSSQALGWAAGAYLVLPRLAGAQPVAITRQAACIAAGRDIYAVYRQPKGKTASEQTAKRARLKHAVCRWASEIIVDFTHGLEGPYNADQEAIADALAIGVAAWIRHQEEERKRAIAAAQRVLLGKGSRGPRAKKEATDVCTAVR